MRVHAVALAVLIIQLGAIDPARTQGAAASDHAIAEKLPLFEKNRCATVKNQAEQLFCGDGELNSAATRLSGAVQDRLNRLPDRSLAIEENAAWIRERNSSCGIIGRDAVRFEDLDATKACLLKETEERIAILRDPNFDCLAANTAAGSLICSDPELALADTDLNDHVLALIAKLGEAEGRDAFAEYARWIRQRDRKCGLAGKDNVPLDELAPSEPCLADVMRDKSAEVAAAKGDPRRVFGRQKLSPQPNADAVDLCVAQIHAVNGCGNFVRVRGVYEIDSAVTEAAAKVTSEVEMVVLSPFAGCSPIASGCTGTCWDLKSGRPQATPASRDSFVVSHRIRVAKVFAFQRADGGGWRCDATSLQPVDNGVALTGP